MQKTTPRIILPVTHNKAKLIAKNYSPNNLYFIIFIFMAFPKGSGFPLNFTPQKLRKSTAKRVSPSYLWATPLLARDFLWLLERSIPAQSLTRPPSTPLMPRKFFIQRRDSLLLQVLSKTINSPHLVFNFSYLQRSGRFSVQRYKLALFSRKAKP